MTRYVSQALNYFVKKKLLSFFIKNIFGIMVISKRSYNLGKIAAILQSTFVENVHITGQNINIVWL